MTKKDHETIAQCFMLAKVNDLWTGVRNGHGYRRAVAERLAVELMIDNPSFDRDRFMRACGFDES